MEKQKVICDSKSLCFSAFDIVNLLEKTYVLYVHVF